MLPAREQLPLSIKLYAANTDFSYYTDAKQRLGAKWVNKKGRRARQKEEEKQAKEQRDGMAERRKDNEKEQESRKQLLEQASERSKKLWKVLNSATKAIVYFSLRVIEVLGALYLLYTMYILVAQVKTRGAAAIIGLDIDSSSDSQRLSWNMGQVVAVLVWVPVLSKYLYAIFCKCCPTHTLPVWMLRQSQLAWRKSSNFAYRMNSRYRRSLSSRKIRKSRLRRMQETREGRLWLQHLHL